MATQKPAHGVQTRAIHAGEGPDPITKASAPNLVMSTTFIVDDAEAKFSASFFNEGEKYVYTRWSNPTVHQLEQKLANLESGGSAVAFASGMAAATTLLLNVLKSGDHVVISDVAYAGVAEFAHDMLPKLGIAVTQADLSDPEDLRKALRPNTRLVHAETPANPILRLTDLRAVADMAHAAGALLSVDSTFATPIATRPLELGADYVLQSLTKYIGGHGDAIGGAVIGSTEHMASLRQHAIRGGGILSPFNAWLILRGMATLPLRMGAHAANALQVARRLEKHPRVMRVIYPGLESHPQRALARRQMQNMSGMLVFQAKEPRRLAQQFADRLRIIHYAVSLGHHRSLIFYLPTDEVNASSFHMDAEHLRRYREWGGEGVFRLSVGLEDAEDIWADLEQAMEG